MAASGGSWAKGTFFSSGDIALLFNSPADMAWAKQKSQGAIQHLKDLAIQRAGKDPAAVAAAKALRTAKAANESAALKLARTGKFQPSPASNFREYKTEADAGAVFEKGKVWTDLINNASRDEQAAVANYVDGYYSDLNKALRLAPANDPLWLVRGDSVRESMVKGLDALMSRSPGLQEDTLLARRVNSQQHIDLIKGGAIVKGSVISDQGYISTSGWSEFPTYASRPDASIWRIRAPKGTKGFSPASMGMSGESEFILNRATKFYVVDISTDSRGRYVLDLEVLSE